MRWALRSTQGWVSLQRADGESAEQSPTSPSGVNRSVGCGREAVEVCGSPSGSDVSLSWLAHMSDACARRGSCLSSEGCVMRHWGAFPSGGQPPLDLPFGVATVEGMHGG